MTAPANCNIFGVDSKILYLSILFSVLHNHAESGWRFSVEFLRTVRVHIVLLVYLYETHFSLIRVARVFFLFFF